MDENTTQETYLDVSQFINTNIREIYLHIGLHKTATSSIQATLNKNCRRLNDFGIYFSSSWGGINHSVPIFSMFCQNPDKYHVNIRMHRSLNECIEFNRENKRILLSEISATNCTKVIISGEDISFLDFNSMLRLKYFLSIAMPNAKIKIIVYVRERTSLISSGYQENIRTGSIPNLIKLNYFSDIYKNRLNNALEIFGIDNIIIAKFEDTVKHAHGPVGHFLELVGVNSDSIIKFNFQKTNVGTSDKAIELLLYINSKIPLVDGDQVSNGRNYNDTSPLGLIKGMKYTLPIDVIQNILDHGKRDNLWLKDIFGIEYPNNINDKYNSIPMRYDKEYYDDILIVFSNVSNVLKKLIYDFSKEKFEMVDDSISKNTFAILINYFEINYPYITTNNLNTVIHKFKIGELEKKLIFLERQLCGRFPQIKEGKMGEYYFFLRSYKNTRPIRILNGFLRYCYNRLQVAIKLLFT